MDGKGHPLPASDEARHDEIPEHDARDKSFGDDEPEAVQPDGNAVTPDGISYPLDESVGASLEGEAGTEADRR